MPLYIYKNNQQLGPWEDEAVRGMLQSGQLAATDLAARPGESEWQPLGRFGLETAPPAVAPAPAQATGLSVSQWAAQNLPEPLEVKLKADSIGAKIATYLLLFSVPLAFVALGLYMLVAAGQPQALAVGVILLVVFALLFLPLIYFSRRKAARAMDRAGVLTRGKTGYQWERLQYVDYRLKRGSGGVHGQGLLPYLISAVALALVRSRMAAGNPRAKIFDAVALVFDNGEALIPYGAKDAGALWDLVETIPAPARLDGQGDASARAKLQEYGVSQAASSSIRQPAAASSPAPQIMQPQAMAAPQAVAASSPAQQAVVAGPQPQSRTSWLVAGALGGCGLLVLGGAGLLGVYFYVASGGRSNKNANISVNKNANVAAPGGSHTFPDTAPEKQADMQITAPEFYRETGETSKWKSGLAKYKGKVLEISGRADLFQDFDGKALFMAAPSGYVKLELESGQAEKLAKLKDDERLKAKCVVGGDSYAELEKCVVLARKPPVTNEDTPDVSLTAKQFYEDVENSKLSYETRRKNRAKYFGQIIELSGAAKKIGSDSHFLTINEKDLIWLTCYPDDDNKAQFAALTEGQNVRFRGVDDGNTLRHCLVSK
jgi:hypothetical protein